MAGAAITVVAVIKIKELKLDGLPEHADGLLLLLEHMEKRSRIDELRQSWLAMFQASVEGACSTAQSTAAKTRDPLSEGASHSVLGYQHLTNRIDLRG